MQSISLHEIVQGFGLPVMEYGALVNVSALPECSREFAA